MPRMSKPLEAREALLAAWRANDRVTAYLVERIPAGLWDMSVPGAPRRTVRSIAAHIHNARCGWMRRSGRIGGQPVAAVVDGARVTKRQLLAALKCSGRQMSQVFERALDRGGAVPGFPLGVVAFLAYAAAHEGHHRGQLCTIVRQLGQRLPDQVLIGLWEWPKRLKEAGG
ncbi:MAG: hypothetical protein HRF50_08395 [Phycisphaerae bacterium]